MIKENSVENFCEDLAQEISERNIMNLSEIALLLKIRFTDNMKIFIQYYSNKAEQKYLSLLEKQSRNRLGTPEYVKIGYELSKAKMEKAIANRGLNEINKDDRLARAKKFIVENHNEETYEGIMSSAMPISKGNEYNTNTKATIEIINNKNYEVLKGIINESLPESLLEEIFHEFNRRVKNESPQKVNIEFHKPEIANFDVSPYRRLLQKYYTIITSTKRKLDSFTKNYINNDISEINKSIPPITELTAERKDLNLF